MERHCTGTADLSQPPSGGRVLQVGEPWQDEDTALLLGDGHAAYHSIGSRLNSNAFGGSAAK